jgi:hypothetical protein
MPLCACSRPMLNAHRVRCAICVLESRRAYLRAYRRRPKARRAENAAARRRYKAKHAERTRRKATWQEILASVQQRKQAA